MVHKTGVYPCSECSKTFSRLEYVTRHQRAKHLGVRPWGCECGVSYARSDLLARHKRSCKLKHCTKSRSNRRDVSKVSTIGYPHSSKSASDTFASHSPRRRDDSLPPTYEQAIAHHKSEPSSSKPRTLASLQSPKISPSAVTLVSSPSRSRALQLQFSDSIGQPQGLVLNLATRRQSSPTRFGIINQDEIGPNSPILEGNDCSVDSNDKNHGNAQEATATSATLGDPVDNVVTYLQPTFFINDIPESSPFYLNPKIWVLAFLCQRSQGFTIPHIGSLSRYVWRATEVMCPMIPMIHVPTFRTSMISIHLGYALSVAGAAFENSEHALAFTDQSLTYKRALVQNDFECRENTFSFRFELLQSLLTYQFLGMFSCLETQRNRAITFSPIVVKDFRDLGFANELRKSPDYIRLALSGQMPLDLAWKSWVKYETQKRTAFLVLVSSFQLRGGPECDLNLFEADLPLPCHEDLWTAENAEKWIQAAREHAANCILDNLDKTSHVENSIAGEQTVPMLSEALAALQLADPKPDHRGYIPDIGRVGENQLTVRAERLGSFARTVIHHARDLARQATVNFRLV